MKFSYKLIGAILILLTCNSCKKEHEMPERHHSANKQRATEVEVLSGCDDTTAFKSSVDLEPLEYLKNCYVCTVEKEVPGLGEISWTGNCEVYIADSTLQIRFRSYEPYFEELLPREVLSFNYVPINIGFHQILDYTNWAADPSKSFGGYGRLLDDGDVADGYWEADTTCVNYIEITRLDLEDREIEGKFEIHLKMKSQGTHGILYSERINFLNGRFKAEIEK
jgi:hypothetical protein